MNLPTDTELEKRALEIALGDFDDYGSSEGLAGIYAATLEALKIERHSLECILSFMENGFSPYIEAHVMELRTRLGM